MIQDERFLRIIDYLRENQTATLADIAQLNDVSIDTVRRDFEQLESGGMLRKVRGGAIFHNADITTQKVDIRGISHKEEKKEIASLVGSYVVDGQAIALNSGTTCVEIAKYLSANYQRLTIITNNLSVIDVVAKAKGFNIIIPGGIIDCNEEAIFGDVCENDILNYNIDTAIFAIHAISLDKGVTDFRLHQQFIIRAMMNAAKHKIVAADHSKFEKTAYVNVCSLNEIDTLISDSGLSPELYQKYQQSGVNIRIPQKSSTVTG